MEIIETLEKASSLCEDWRKKGESVTLVPTMGFFHEGHASLMRHARNRGDKVVVSLFVNPTQFAPNEDLDSYPRNLEKDAALAQSLGVDMLFAPRPEEMYTPEHATVIMLPHLSKGLCGISRPTHFNGVVLVCLKLFMISRATRAVFGQKDWQQTAIIRRMVHDLNIPIAIDVCPTVREADGLALSSRNVYLTLEEREQAPEIYKSLCYAKELVGKGESNVHILRGAVLHQMAERLPLGRLDYLSVVDAGTLETLDTVSDTAVMACAVRMGKARLIDNISL